MRWVVREKDMENVRSMVEVHFQAASCSQSAAGHSVGAPESLSGVVTWVLIRYEVLGTADDFPLRPPHHSPVKKWCHGQRSWESELAI